MLPPFPAKISLATLPSPFRPLDRLSELLGGPRIWLKSDDMTGSLLSGNKIRKLEYIIARALGDGCNTLITCGGLQSNHCRATAVAGAQQGLKVHLILRGQAGEEADGNLLIDKLSGAEISIYDPQQYTNELPALFQFWREHYAKKNGRAFCIPTGASDEHGLWGYLDASRELQDDFKRQGIQPELVVCATGSGGTQTGLSLGFALMQKPTRVLGMAVCDNARYFYNKAHEDINAWSKALPKDYLKASAHLIQSTTIDTNDTYIGPGYARAYEGVYDTIKLLAKTEGQILDPVYTGKAFHGLVSEIKSGKWAHLKNIVFVHTGGIFGLFPYKNELELG